MIYTRATLAVLAFTSLTQPALASSSEQGSLAPSKDAISACYAHSEGEGCSYRNENAIYVSGKCTKLSDNRRKVCTETRPSS